MIEKIKQIFNENKSGRYSKPEIEAQLPFSIESKYEIGRKIIKDIITSKNSADMDFCLLFHWVIDEDDDCIDLLHEMLLETWHEKYHAIIKDLQWRQHPSSVSFIKIAMQQKFDYLESYSTGTGQFINQCGHALDSIGTEEAIAAIRNLAENSEDPIVKVEMVYRLSKMFPEEYAHLDENEELPRWFDFD